MITKREKLRDKVEEVLAGWNFDAQIPTALWNRLLTDATFLEDVERLRLSDTAKYKNRLLRLALVVKGAIICHRCYEPTLASPLQKATLGRYRKAWALHRLDGIKHVTEQMAARKAAEMGLPINLKPLPLDHWQHEFESGGPAGIFRWISGSLLSPKKRSSTAFRTMRSKARKDYQEWEKYYQTRCEVYKGKFGHEPWDVLFEMHLLEGKTDEEFLPVMEQLCGWSTKQDAAQEDNTQAAQ